MAVGEIMFRRQDSDDARRLHCRNYVEAYDSGVRMFGPQNETPRRGSGRKIVRVATFACHEMQVFDTG